MHPLRTGRKRSAPTKLLHPTLSVRACVCVIKARFVEKLSDSIKDTQQERWVWYWCTRSPVRRKDMQGAADSEVDEKLFNRRRHAQNPLVPIGVFVTAGVLAAGLMSFQQGDSHLGQKLMRARVVAQGVTVALMVGTAYYCGQKFANH